MSDHEKDDETGPAPLPAPSPVEHGGRVELRLIESSPGETRYAARWFTAHEELEGHVQIAGEKNEVVVDSPESLPSWLESFTSSLVRTTARQAHKENTWPRRLTRWRKAPKGED